MQFKSLLTTATALLTISSSAALPSFISSSLGDRPLCSLEEFDNAGNFTGIVIQHQKSIEYPPQDHLRITRCLEGNDRPYDAYVATNMVQDIPWGRKICTGYKNQKASCYVIARRQGLHKRELSVYAANEWVGGIFLCPGSLSDDGIACTNKNAVPLYPLIGASYKHYRQNVRISTIIRSPILVSFDPLTESTHPNPYAPRDQLPENWAEYIDIEENYKDESHGIETMFENSWNYLLNLFRHTTKMSLRVFFLPSNANFKSFGDLRVRRPIRKLEAKVTYEQDPVAFNIAPSLSYLERPEFSRKGAKKAMKKVHVQAVDNSEPVHAENDANVANVDPAQVKKILADADFLDAFDQDGTPVVSYSELSFENLSNLKKVSFNKFMELAVTAPDHIFHKVMEKVVPDSKSQVNFQEELKGKKTFKHAELDQHPSDLLESYLSRD